MCIQIPAFGESNYGDTVSNRNTRIVNICEASEQLFQSYLKMLEEAGFSPVEHRACGQNLYAAFNKDGTGIFLNYYGTLSELNIAIEQNCGYFTFAADAGEAIVTPQITQVHLADFGMSYAIRLSDGRFIVIDGGWGFEPDVQELYRVLKEGTPVGKPVVAAWFLTHPHRDHHLCFAEFILRYPDEVVIEKLLMNYPEPDDLAHYPEMTKEDWRVADTATINRVPRMLSEVNRLGIPIYEPHSGQIYRIGDAVCQILSCMDDTILLSDKINPTSLVIRMELGGQVILWTADASFSVCRLVERYGSYLKADIMQVPHHGFQSGTAEGEIAGYDLARPRACFIPVAEYHVFIEFGPNRGGTKHMMTNIGLEELIAGDATRTITLPYEPPKWAKEQLRKSYMEGLDSNGAKVWIFADMNSDNPEDFQFSFFNGNINPAQIKIELYFDGEKRVISGILATVPPRSYKKLCITDPEQINTNAEYFNWERLEVKGIPEETGFAVRFRSDRPVVVSNRNHAAVYHSINR